MQFNQDREKTRLPNLYSGAVEKPCVTCKVVKHVQEFSQRRAEADGLNRMCRDCVRISQDDWMQRNIDHVRAKNLVASKKYAAAHPDRRADAYMRCKYGISLAEYTVLLEEQGGTCAICGAPPSARPRSDRKILCIDHCHATGVIRGLLCRACNHGIGHFSDSPEVLRKAAAYLEAVAVKNGRGT